ncbi:serine hydrolase, partial [Xanthomonas citri pv. citri]|nr:serine hydrolase [Xanthomonas citri pv. citri]
TGFVSTAEELSRFFSALALDRRELLDEHALRLMHRAEAAFPRGTGTGTYGLGLIGISVDGRRLVGHSGGFPGQITRTLVDPATGLTV